MEIRIFERDLTLCSFCDTAVSVTASEQFAGAGSLRLTVPLGEAGRFRPDRILTLPGVGSGYVVETVREDAASGTAEIGGRGVLSLFERIALPGDTTFFGMAEPWLLDLAVRRGPAALSAPLTTVEYGREETVYAALSDASLLTVMQTAAGAAGLGLRLAATAGGYVFSVRAAADSGILLSRGAGDLAEGIRRTDRRNYANRIHLTGADGIRVTLDAAGLFSDGTDDAAEPLREIIRHTSAIGPSRYGTAEEYLTALRAEARRILAGRRPVTSAELSVVPERAGQLTVGSRYAVEDELLGIGGTLLCTGKTMQHRSGKTRWTAEMTFTV